MTALRVLSMGWGRQTWTLAAMMALGELPRVDFIVHADTTHEREATYAFRRQWEPWLGEHGLKVVTVREPVTTPVQVGRSKTDGVMIPAFTSDRETGEAGQVGRQCTMMWKVRPIRRFIREELDRRKIQVTPGVVESWQGISLDEFQRMRSSDVGYITNVYPLVDRQMSLSDCVTWLASRSLPIPPKSACVFCPFHKLADWRAQKRAGGSDWTEALAVDSLIREKRTKMTLYVHPARKPLAEAVAIPEDFGASQATLFGEENACDSGYCMT